MKSLQERLRDLEKHGMLTRTRYDEQPARVEHTITLLGQRTAEVMVALKEIASQMEKVTCICPMESSCSAMCPKRTTPETAERRRGHR